MINSATIAKRLSKIINESGLSRPEIASQAGVSPTAISYWVNNKRNINLIDYIKICEACGVPNGIFSEREMTAEIPPEVSQQAEELIQVLIEIHQLVGGGSDSPFDVFVENAHYMRNLALCNMDEDLRSVAEKSDDTYKSSADKRKKN